MQSNIVTDTKLAIKKLIEDNISPLSCKSTGSGGVAPSGKIPSVTLGDLKRSPQIMPQIQIILVADMPDLTRGQTYNHVVFYREPSKDVPNVEVTVIDEAGTERKETYYRSQYIQPQKYVFRFRMTILAETEEECEDVHTQLQTLFEGQRDNILTVIRNADDEAEYEEKFVYKTLGGRHFPFDGELSRSVIEIDVQAYHDVAAAPVKQVRVQKVNQSNCFIEE